MQRRTFLISLASAMSAGCAGLATQEGPATVLGVIEYGQSNSEGQAMKSAAVLRTDYPRQLRMPLSAAGNVWLGQATVGGRSLELAPGAVTGLGPLHGAMGSSTHGSTAGEGMALRLVEQPVPGAPAPDEIVLFNVAEGGQAIRNLAKDAPPNYYGYRNLIRVTEGVQAALQKERKRYVVRVVITAQGETDPRQPRLGEMQDKVRAEIEAGVRAITGQREGVWMLSSQPSSFEGSSSGARAILEQHVRTLSAGGAYFCLGPTYNYAFAHDFLHHSSEGHDMRGELYAVAYQSLLRDGRWDVLRALDAKVVQPNQIAVTLSEAAEVAHVDGLPQPVHLGLQLAGAEIEAVQVQGARILITTRGAAAGVKAVRLGLAGHGARRSAETVPRTSVRSAAAYGNYRNGTPIRKWLCHQELALA